MTTHFNDGTELKNYHHSEHEGVLTVHVNYLKDNDGDQRFAPHSTTIEINTSGMEDEIEKQIAFVEALEVL